MTQVFVAPEYVVEADIEFASRLFIAGGISDCPNWQETVVKQLDGIPATIFNPRRENFPINDPAAGLEQITWEFRALQFSTSVLFWFPEETVCPITLLELGTQLAKKKNLFIGYHPNYSRKLDVFAQTRLARDDVSVINESLDDLVNYVWTNLGKW